ncbi:MAG: dihydropyrimidinase [Anaerolineae bacterium]|nr:dihydropyrimidinase [Anaerolineae bacterium]
MFDTVIRNGTVVTADEVFPADVGIVGERIAALGEALEGTTEIDARGCYVLPGGIDPHVHLQMPQGAFVSADDFASGTAAAALGGTTTVIDFVEPAPEEPLLAAFEKRRAQADGRVAVDYGLHMTIPAWHAGQPAVLNALDAVVAAGMPSFKLYMAYAGLHLDDVQLYRAMAAIAKAGGLPIVHCENGPLCDALRADALSHGETSPIHHAFTRPPRQEAEAVGRAIDVAALAGAPLYVVHISCAEALARVQDARAGGEDVYGETCPQYLFLNAQLLDQPGGERLICAPPLREPEDNEALWEGLSGGDVDVLSTDHCPFTAAEKAGHAAFTTIPGGVPSIEARLSLAHTFGQPRGMSLPRWVEVCCSNPARIFGLERKGRVIPGFDADLVVFDPERWVRIEAGQTLHERVDWSPYEGLHVQGWPRDVFSRGRAVVRDGAFVGQAGWGQFVARGGS